MINKDEKAITPVSVIRKQMKFHQLTETELAKEMGISKSQLDKLLSGEAKITRSMAAKLEKVLVLPVDFWMNLEELYQKKLDEK